MLLRTAHWNASISVSKADLIRGYAFAPNHKTWPNVFLRTHPTPLLRASLCPQPSILHFNHPTGGFSYGALIRSFSSLTPWGLIGYINLEMLFFFYRTEKKISCGNQKKEANKLLLFKSSHTLIKVDKWLTKNIYFKN